MRVSGRFAFQKAVNNYIFRQVHSCRIPKTINPNLLRDEAILSPAGSPSNNIPATRNLHISANSIPTVMGASLTLAPSCRALSSIPSSVQHPDMPMAGTIHPLLPIGPRHTSVKKVRRLIGCEVERPSPLPKIPLITYRGLMSAFTQPSKSQGSVTGFFGTLLLSAEEVAELTGTIQPARQVRWLDERGWPYALANGRSQYPRVARSVFDAKMVGKDPTSAPPAPKLEALDRLARFA